MDRLPAESETEKLVVLPGFEVSQTRKKPESNIILWVQCFARYTAAMAQHFPECTPGIMSHMLTVMKAFREVEDPAWRLYDEAYREKRWHPQEPELGRVWTSLCTRSCVGAGQGEEGWRQHLT